MTDQLEDRAPFVPAPDPIRVLADLEATQLTIRNLTGHAGARRGPLVSEIQRLLKALAELVRVLDREYPLAYEVAYSQVVRGDGGGSQIDQSDPAGNVVSGTRQRYLRRALAGAAAKVLETRLNAGTAWRLTDTDLGLKPVRAKIQDAIGTATAAGNIIERALEHDGIDVTADNRRVKEAQDRGIIPPPMHKAELLQLQETKARRERA